MDTSKKKHSDRGQHGPGRSLSMKELKRPVLITIMLGMILALSCINCFPCFAQEFSIKIYPSMLELAVEPGTTQAFNINVLNEGTDDQRLRVYDMDYVVTPDNRTTFEKPGHYSFSCASWITTETKAFDLPAGQEETIAFSITAPPDAEPGSHNAVIFFEVIPKPREDGETEVQSTGRIGTVVLTTVPGEIVREGEIESVSVQSKWLWPSKKLPVVGGSSPEYRVVVNNTGNVHITTKGVLYYTPTFGWGMGSIQLPLMTVLPRTKRYYEGTLPEPPFLGSYDVTVEIMYGPSMTEFDTSRTGSTAFHVYPSFLLLMFIVLIALLVAVVKLVKHFMGKKKAPEVKAGEEAEEGEKKEEPEGEKEEEREEEPQPEERWAELSEEPGDETEVTSEEKERDSGDAGDEGNEAAEESESEDKKEEKEESPEDEDSGDGGEREDTGNGEQKESGEKEKPHKRGSDKLSIRRLFKRGRKK